MRKSNPRGRLNDGNPNPIDVYVGSRIKSRRSLLGMTQHQLADAIRLTFQQIQKYEHGANRVGASRLHDLSRVLGVQVQYFFDEMPTTIAASSPALLDKTTQAFVPFSQDREFLELAKAYAKLPQGARDNFRRMMAAFHTPENQSEAA